MNIRFGLPRKEVVSKEKFPETPVLTMEHVEDKGFNRRFVLNKKAVELLNLVPGESQVVFAFDGENSAYISKDNSEDSLLLGKNMAFSHKKYYEYISKLYKLDSRQDSYFELTDAIMVGAVTVYRMKPIQLREVETTTLGPVVDKEIEHIGQQENLNFKELLQDLAEEQDLYISDLLDEDVEDLIVDEDTGEIITAKRSEFIMNAY